MDIRELKTIEEKVKYLLVKVPATRDSDKKLISEYVSVFAPNLRLMTFTDAITKDRMPSPETLRRTRQKVQAAHPSLQSSKRIGMFREENEEVFREYARGGV